MDQQSIKSAFSIVKLQQEPTHYQKELEDYATMLIRNKQKIQIIQYFNSGETLVFVKFLFNLVLSLFIGSNVHKQNPSVIQNLLKNPFSLRIRISLFKIVAHIIENRLYSLQPQRYYEQLSFSMLFNNNLLLFITNLLSDGSSYIRLDYFYQFLANKNQLGKYIYSLYGGEGIKISKSNFKVSVINVMKKMEQFLISQNNIIIRNIKILCELKDKKVLDNNLIGLANLNNPAFISNQIDLLADQIFQNDQYLSRNIFIEKINRIKTVKTDEKSLPLRQYLNIYFDILYLQVTVVQGPEFQKEVMKREKVEISNYYMDSMQKLLKKCLFNGHESCNCKKCQCVRRNRESAKLSQQKKRNAVEQLGQIQFRIIELEKINSQLNEENLILRGLFEQFKDHPSFKDVLSKASESINKILHNDE